MRATHRQVRWPIRKTARTALLPTEQTERKLKVRSVVFKSPHLQRWLAGMAISVFGLSTVAAVVVQIPSSIGISAVGKRPAVAESRFVDSDCADCGSIESNRVVETHLAPARPAKLAAR